MTDQTHHEHGQWVRAALQRYEDPLLRYAAKLLGGNIDSARDVVQDTFLRLCEQSQDEIGEFLAQWLYTVCRNRALEERRKDRNMSTIMSDGMVRGAQASPQPYEAIETEESLTQVLQALNQLASNQQEALRLKFQHGLRYKEIAEVMEITVNYVGVLIHNGLQELRVRLTDTSDRITLQGGER